MPKGPPNRTRSHHVCLYLSDEELSLLHERMKKTGYTNASKFIRRMIINGAIVIVGDSDDVKRTNYEINRIGNNINQLVHLANAKGSVSKDDIDSVMELLASVWRTLAYILSPIA